MNKPKPPHPNECGEMLYLLMSQSWLEEPV